LLRDKDILVTRYSTQEEGKRRCLPQPYTRSRRTGHRL
jgi:hypothetical protein